MAPTVARACDAPAMRWLAAVALAGCMSPVVHFGSGKSAEEAQHDTLGELVPPQLSIEGTWHGTVKDAKIRVYADDEYRAQNLKWRETFGEELEYANAVLGPSFGVHLVAEYREWSHHAPGNTLADDLDELRRLDSGEDVLSVVGLTSSIGLVSATFDLLGIASLPGRHVMLRGYADLEERAAFARAFPALHAEERENALEARRRHKTTAVLLHELGHNLGAPHETATDTLMNAKYSVHAAEFSAEAHAIIQRTLDQRLGRAPAEPARQVAQPPRHPTLHVHLATTGVAVDGDARDDDALAAVFRAQAAQDPATEVVIEKDRGVPTAKLVELIDRAKAAGLTKFTIQ
jgi:biopolymer transport protein ExbD